MVEGNNIEIPDCKEMMPEASDNGSQPYSRAYGYGEMAGESDITQNTLLICKGQELTMSPTQGQAILYGGVIPYQPFRNTQGRFCMAGYHCLMPTAFFPLRHST